MRNIDINEYKFSKYNSKIDIGEETYLFNSITRGYGKLDKRNKEILKNINFEANSTLEIPEQVIEDSDFLEKLIMGKFIIRKDIDELRFLKALHYNTRFSMNNSFGLTIIPTFACNFRCPYCFERDQKYPSISMNDEIMEKTIELVKSKVKENGQLSINWFGGEPLLELNKIKKMQLEFNKIAKEKNAGISTGIVTNGYLLTKSVSDELAELGITNVQVTVDGNKEIHDSKRMLANGGGTYEKIIENLLSSNENISIAVRVNIDKNNIKCMDSFLDSLSEIGLNKKKNINIYFSVLRDYDNSTNCIAQNCYVIREYAEEEAKLYELAIKKGFYIQRIPSPNVSNCGAVSPNVLLIEPDGGIQKCWSVVGDLSKRVGHLIENNNPLYESNNIKWMGWDAFEDKECVDCKSLPLCMGGCPYFSIYGEKPNSQYKCNPLVYNLEDTLKMLAYQDASNQ